MKMQEKLQDGTYQTNRKEHPERYSGFSFSSRATFRAFRRL
jgi:hypothetical protein